MNNKYELLTDKTIISCGRKLFRIRALEAFADVKPGDEGGYIESEKNLSVCGNAWVYEEAQVFGDAHICENACVSGRAQVYRNARVSGSARVFEEAQIFGDACVSGRAQVYGNACIYNTARIYEDAQVGRFARIYGSAQIYGNAQIHEDARIYEDAQIYRDVHHFCISPIGSRDDIITFFRTKELKILVTVGCFCGDIDQFEAQVQKTHGDNKHAIVYALAAQLARTRIDLTD